MYYAANSNQMKKIDDYSTEVIKIPALVLMERAAAQVAALIREKVNKEDRILAVCGTGNNGGDAVAAARILYLEGYHVAVMLLGEVSKATLQTKTQLEIAQNLNIPFETNNKLDEYNIIIDGIFGVGLSRPVSGIQEQTISIINQNKNQVFAVDMPSGISADTGSVLNIAVHADYTVTFGFQKQGLLLYPGAAYAGEIHVADIGFPMVAAQKAKLDTFYYGREDLRRLPCRNPNGHKGSFGKILIIAGSKGMSGAAYFSAKAAYKTGAGLVQVLTASDNRMIMQTSLPEALYTSYDHDDLSREDWESKILSLLSWASAIVIGPGLGQSELADAMLRLVIQEAKVPVVIDADAINLLGKQLDCRTMDTESRLQCLKEMLRGQIILTPHWMELSRLLGITIAEMTENIMDIAGKCSYHNSLIYVMKSARTMVVQQERRYINVSGNNGMATGGSGDVLTGIIAALIGQGMETWEAACLAVYIHGLAGDRAAKEKGVYSMVAGDIADFIGSVIKMDA